MARRYDRRRIKIHRTYSVSEVERVLCVHPNTVRRWIKVGLRVIEEKRPILIHGADLREFLAALRPCPSRLRPGEIYCVACRGPRRPAGEMAEYRPTGPARGALIGICPTCDRLIYRRVTFAGIEQARGQLEVDVPERQQRLDDIPFGSIIAARCVTCGVVSAPRNAPVGSPCARPVATA